MTNTKKEYVAPAMTIIEMDTANELLCGSNSYWDNCDQHYDEPQDYWHGNGGDN